MKRWRVQITWPGDPGGTATFDIEEPTDWQALLELLRIPGAVPTQNMGFSVNVNPLPPQEVKS